jgi:hypothetical protein
MSRLHPGQNDFLERGLAMLRKENALEEENKLASLKYNKQKYILSKIMNGGMIITGRYGAKRVLRMAWTEFSDDGIIGNLLNKVETDVLDDTQVIDELVAVLDNFAKVYPEKVVDMWATYTKLGASLSPNEEDYYALLSKNFDE